MRTPNLGTVSYFPSDPPNDKDDLPRYLNAEFQKVAAAITALALGHLDKTSVAPTKPRDGDIRYADGIVWNPGAGVGIYYYKASAWVLLG